MISNDSLESAYQKTLAALLAERHPDGYWIGELSTSALSTATAVAALSLVQKRSAAADRFAGLIKGGLSWLAKNQNADGGWGDTVVSFSNISTTMLCRAAIHIADAAAEYAEVLKKAENWLAERYGRTPRELAEAVRKRYGKDRTFAVPILTTCALAGLTSWTEVPSLPFELACFPQSWFRFLNLQVVSYALPALIAIGQAVYHHRPPWNPIMRFFRWLAKGRSLKVLEAIQPSSGGFLEATPLTSFVTLSLASIGLAEHPVARNGVRFIVDSVRPDGSWPIDTNLSTWVTTLSINALAAAGELSSLDKKPELVDWLVRQQYKVRHPYTGAAPGGWAWTPLPGGVPDMDDSPGALLALDNITRSNPQGSEYLTLGHTGLKEVECKPQGEVLRTLGTLPGHLTNPRIDSSMEGMRWSLALQNSDGGWPTFCRGWGKLPFDRSGADLTAHALRALGCWGALIFGDMFRGFLKGNSYRIRIESTPEGTYLAQVYWGIGLPLSRALPAGLKYLAKQQRRDGSWLPLWFGNQHAPDDENPTYGTAKVLAAYRDLDMMSAEPARRGVSFLLSIQNADGGWGGAKNTPSSMEETALAVEILLDAGPAAPARADSDRLRGSARPETQTAVNKGLAYLVQKVEEGGLYKPTPIGFYFAKLWYSEKLYPIIFTLAALGRARTKNSPLAVSRQQRP